MSAQHSTNRLPTKKTIMGAHPSSGLPTKRKAATVPSHADDGNRNLIRANILALGLLVLVSGVSLGMFIWAQTKKTEVIAMTESREITRPIPLNQAYAPVSRVLSFVEGCLRSSLSHDFENYIQTMNAAQGRCYTEPGGKEFVRVMDPTLMEIKSKRVVLSSSTMPAVLRLGPRMVAGHVAWDVESVVTLNFQGTQTRYPQQMRAVSVQVVRVPIEEDPGGIRINSILFKPYRPQ